jgi:hypothetical protein
LKKKGNSVFLKDYFSCKKNMQKNKENYIEIFLFPLSIFQKPLSKVVLQIEVGSYHNSLFEKEKCNFSIS